MESDTIHVHSVAEAYLVLMVRRCEVCDRGPLEARADLTKARSGDGQWELPTNCPTCGNDEVLEFRIAPEPTPEQAATNWVNPTQERSRAIDLLGWLTLFRSILEASKKETDKSEIRKLAIECAQCLDEALKFYEPDNELPNQNAFFSEESLTRFRDLPQQFTRSRWLHERSKLPVVVFRTPKSENAGSRRWWQLWRRRDPRGNFDGPDKGQADI
ncbi:MAG: hypothetical protein O7D94_05205 [Planctomycetota bacterium]|nr:hypothetical protein [Planctomycetota bacterium]